MADSEQDQVDEDGACCPDESLRDQARKQTAETDGQVSDGRAQGSGSSSPNDKGKASARAHDNLPSDGQLHDAESSRASPPPQTHTTTSEITERVKKLSLPTISATNPADRRISDGSNESGTDSGNQDHRTQPQEQPLTSRQKQKQKAEPEESAEPGPTHSKEASGGHSTVDQAEPPAFRPLRPGDPGWERSADRPPKKLPIRLKDAVGRQYVFPWEKAKTWEGMERLIRACFVHVDLLGPYVMDRRYDLLTHMPFPEPDTGAAQPVGSPAPVHNGTASVPTTSSTPAASPDGGGATIGASTPSASATPPPALPAPSPPQQQQLARTIILPELWEDIVEPGMSISMHMWPIDWPADAQPPPPAVPPPPPAPVVLPNPPLPPAIAVAVPPAPAPPPPPPHHHLLAASWTAAAGRGGGRGRGFGRGVPVAFPHAQLPRQLAWVEVGPPKPRGKTRRRQEGP
ncbi:hypothetical protein GGR52DRAFT_535000 [Hypoxylon sp. FL1284]|nr:hypothetical protein GGR52DRAFT_535000 [Hypoxylon sp. FL1284]